jgi:hypothetical protein
MEFPHFEGNHKTQDGRGSPKSQRSGSPFSIVEDVVAGFASPISTTSPQNVGKGERSFFHLDLCIVVEIL